MSGQFTRRRFLAATGGAAVAAGAMLDGLGGMSRALAAESLVGVTWGGLWVDATKPMAEAWGKRKDTRIAWELHEGSSITVATKMRATWPVVKYDIVSGNDPLFHILIKEGWIESLDDLSNLADIQNEFVIRDPQGKAVSLPKSVDAVTWGYRTDLIKEPITSMAQFLEPRFKSKIALRAPISYQGLHIISMALERGGNERNMDPGFDFLKELARSGNVAMVGKSGVDLVNAVNTGEAAICFLSSSEWTRIRRNHPVKILTRLPESKSLKSYYTFLHWGVPKGPKARLAKDFINDFVSAENNESYNRQIGGAPTNRKSKVSPDLSDYYVTPDEVAKFAYVPDFLLMTEKGSDWVKRFDLEIRPLLKG